MSDNVSPINSAEDVQTDGSTIPAQAAAAPTAATQDVPAWQDKDFMAKIQRLLNGEEKISGVTENKVLGKIQEAVKVAQDIRGAVEKASQQVRDASMQAERAEGQVQAYVSVLKGILEA